MCWACSCGWPLFPSLRTWCAQSRLFLKLCKDCSELLPIRHGKSPMPIPYSTSATCSLFIWFTGPLARLVERLVPIPPAPAGIRPKYLDEFFLEQPALALDQVRRELVHMGGLVKSMIDRSLDAAMAGSESDAAALSRADDDVDKLYEEIIGYLGKLSQKSLINPQPQYLHNFVGIANYMENIGDVVEKDLLAIAGKRIRKKLVVSESTATELRALAREVCRAFDQALTAVETGDPDDALDVFGEQEGRGGACRRGNGPYREATCG